MESIKTFTILVQPASSLVGLRDLHSESCTPGCVYLVYAHTLLTFFASLPSTFTRVARQHTYSRALCTCLEWPSFEPTLFRLTCSRRQLPSRFGHMCPWCCLCSRHVCADTIGCLPFDAWAVTCVYWTTIASSTSSKTWLRKCFGRKHPTVS